MPDQNDARLSHIRERLAAFKPDLRSQPTNRAVEDMAWLVGTVDDLRSRLACVVEATYWDRPYDTRIAAIRGMCDLSTNGMTPAPEVELRPELEVGVGRLRRMLPILANYYDPVNPEARDTAMEIVRQVIEDLGHGDESWEWWVDYFAADGLTIPRGPLRDEESGK